MNSAERERRLIRTVEQAEWRRRMLRAGGINPDDLSEQGRRILAWLADWDDWTVGGVAEMLAAAYHAGLAAATTEPEPVGQDRRDGDGGSASIPTRLDALQRRPSDPEVGL